MRTLAPTALKMAFAMAGPITTIGGSPMPKEAFPGFQPAPLPSSGWRKVRDLIAVKVMVQHLSILEVDFFGERRSDAMVMQPSTCMDAPTGFTIEPASTASTTRMTCTAPVFAVDCNLHDGCGIVL